MTVDTLNAMTIRERTIYSEISSGLRMAAQMLAMEIEAQSDAVPLEVDHDNIAGSLRDLDAKSRERILLAIEADEEIAPLLAGLRAALEEDPIRYRMRAA